MPDVGAVAGNLSEKIGSFFSSISDLLQATHLPEQISDVDVTALFSNPWFLVPFVGFIIYISRPFAT